LGQFPRQAIQQGNCQTVGQQAGSQMWGGQAFLQEPSIRGGFVSGPLQTSWDGKQQTDRVRGLLVTWPARLRAVPHGCNLLAHLKMQPASHRQLRQQ
jgi:hypothetical protein